MFVCVSIWLLIYVSLCACVFVETDRWRIICDNNWQTYDRTDFISILKILWKVIDIFWRIMLYFSCIHRNARKEISTWVDWELQSACPFATDFCSCQAPHHQRAVSTRHNYLRECHPSPRLVAISSSCNTYVTRDSQSKSNPALISQVITR